MFARKIVPILLVAGAVHLMLHHSQYGFEEQPGLPGDGVARGPQFRHGPFAHRGDWTNRVPPMFDMLHNRAHAAQAAAQNAAQSGQTAQPSTPAV